LGNIAESKWKEKSKETKVKSTYKARFVN